MSEKPPYETRYPALNAPNVVPEADNIRERWTPVMERWGTSMKTACVGGMFLLKMVASDIMCVVSKTLQRWLLSALVFLATPSKRPVDTGMSHISWSYTCAHALPSPHLLAPTASDLVKYGDKDTILAGFHTDLNFLTIHGRSRYPGLNIWARNSGKRIAVRFPPTGRYLLVQAGKQLEHLSGGLVKAGFHEVVVNDATLAVSRTVPPCSCDSR